jgi:hypothetical protein
MKIKLTEEMKCLTRIVLFKMIQHINTKVAPHLFVTERNLMLQLEPLT